MKKPTMAEYKAIAEYNQLPLVPAIVAHNVALAPYTGAELSTKLRDPTTVQKIEKLRLERFGGEYYDVKEFVHECNQRCRDAFIKKAPWFMKMVRAKGDAGRDQLYIWCSHWLAEYLTRKPT